MRELKFRAWDIDNKEFIYAHIGQDDVWIDDGISVIVMPLHHSEWERPTGLRDKNGKEIYEGDIVDYNDDGGCIGVVEYDAPKYLLNISAETWAILKGAPHQRVIGNIHENPELLEQDNAED